MARDRDDYDDRPTRGSSELTGLDKFFNNIGIGILFAVIGVLCCPLLSIVLGGIGMATCKNPDSKKSATIALVGGILGIILNIVLYATGILNFNAQLGGAR